MALSTGERLVRQCGEHTVKLESVLQRRSRITKLCCSFLRHVAGKVAGVEKACARSLRKAADTAANADTLALETTLSSASNVAAIRYTVARPTTACKDDSEVLRAEHVGAKALCLALLENAAGRRS